MTSYRSDRARADDAVDHKAQTQVYVDVLPLEAEERLTSPVRLPPCDRPSLAR